MKEIIVKVISTEKTYKRDAMEKADLFPEEISGMRYQTTTDNLSEKDIKAGKKMYTVRIVLRR
jgi:hypothetical protein